MTQPKMKTDIEARVMDTGDIMTDNLAIKTVDTLPQIHLIPANGTNGAVNLYKNASTVADFGLQIVDFDVNGNNSRIIINANQKNNFDKSFYLKVYDAETKTSSDFPIYHTGYKPSAADINAVSRSGDTMTGKLNANGNISIKNTNPHILLNDSNANYNFYVQALKDTIALGYGYNNSLLINTKGQLILQTSTTISGNAPASISFYVTQTDNNITTKSAFIRVYDDHSATTYGTNMVIQSGGNMIIGSGEAPFSCYSNDLKDSISENTYIVSDTNIYFYTNCNTYANKKSTVYIDTSGVLYGAAWNDYAEFRTYSEDEIPYGRVIIENGDDTIRLASKRMELGAMICSDTFGFAIGETNGCKIPVAVSGRVLAYPYEDREVFKNNIGKPVCSGPNGTVSIMSDEEYKEKGYCCLGVISAVPDYEVWGSGNVAVDGRVWISVK